MASIMAVVRCGNSKTQLLPLKTRASRSSVPRRASKVRRGTTPRVRWTTILSPPWYRRPCSYAHASVCITPLSCAKAKQSTSHSLWLSTGAAEGGSVGAKGLAATTPVLSSGFAATACIERENKLIKQVARIKSLQLTLRREDRSIYYYYEVLLLSAGRQLY